MPSEYGSFPYGTWPFGVPGGAGSFDGDNPPGGGDGTPGGGDETPGTLPGGLVVPLVPWGAPAYFLSVRDKDGKALLPVTRLLSGSWTSSLSEAGTLQIQVDPRDQCAELLRYGHQLWLYDSRYPEPDIDQPLERFHIHQVVKARAESTAPIRVTAHSLLSQLADEWVLDYTCQDKPLHEILADWFNDWQVNARPLTLYHVSPDLRNTTLTLNVRRKNILYLLNDLKRMLGGALFADSLGRVFWLSFMGNGTVQQLRYGKNATLLEKLESGDNGVVNRLYAYGRDGLTVEAAGHTHPYIDAPDSQALYGLRPGVYENNGIEDPAALFDIAETLLETTLKIPRLSYRINLVDLAQTFRDTASWERLTLGSFVSVDDSELGINVRTQLVRVTRNLTNPLDLDVELNTRTLHLGDVLTAVLDHSERLYGNRLELTPLGTDLIPGFADWGDSRFAARDNHQHDLRQPPYSDQLQEIVIPGGGADVSDAPPLPVALVPNAGDDTQASRADHEHPIWPGTQRRFVVASAAPPMPGIAGTDPTSEVEANYPGFLGFSNGDRLIVASTGHEYAYFVPTGNWLPVSHLR